jgi:kynurenine formamidase
MTMRDPLGTPPAKIPDGYADVDPRTARRVPLWHELGPQNPLFPGDPPLTLRRWTTIADGGFLVEQVTSLGSHTGTHVSVPAHVIDGGTSLADLDESWTLMPLAVVDIQDRLPSRRLPQTDPRATHHEGLLVEVADLLRWEEHHGHLPEGGCLLLRTGLADRYRPAAGYGDNAPGLSGEAVAWLFDRRHLRAIGSDSFGPDARVDHEFRATRTALARGGLTVENVGPGLAQMRPHGDWVTINGPRPRWSGCPVGITGFTLPLPPGS